MSDVFSSYPPPRNTIPMVSESAQLGIVRSDVFSCQYRSCHTTNSVSTLRTGLVFRGSVRDTVWDKVSG